MWDILGFSESPYDTRPLGAVKKDAAMLVARSDEAIKFCTTLDSRRDGVLVLSGPPGVGKTSFLNVQQYLLSTGEAPFGPKVLPAYVLTPVNPGDTAEGIAQRVVQNIVKSIERYCELTGHAIPKQVQTIRKWVSAHGSSGFDIGLQIFGFGGNVARSTEIPALRDATFERLLEVVAALVSECVNDLKVSALIVVLDNLENLDNEELKSVLMTFRDTLFSAPSVWWVLIGQSGLGSLIRELDPRVADRIEGAGLELNPLSLNDLHEAVRRRVERFSNREDAKAPVPHSVHKLLYDCSGREIRFVFKYANTICTRYIGDIRKSAMAAFDESNYKRHDIDKMIGDMIVERPLEGELAEEILRSIAVDELKQSALSNKELDVLDRIGKAGSARGRDHDLFGVKSNQQFSSRYLVPLRQRQFLTRRQEGAGVIYSLRGLASLAFNFSLLSPTHARGSS